MNKLWNRFYFRVMEPLGAKLVLGETRLAAPVRYCKRWRNARGLAKMPERWRLFYAGLRLQSTLFR